MFGRLPLSFKLLITFVPLFLVLIVDAYILTSNAQEEAMLEQAKTAAFEKANIVRLSLVQQMLDKKKIEDDYLASLEGTGGIGKLYIRIYADNLKLPDSLLRTDGRYERLKRREIDAQSRGTDGNEVFRTARPVFLNRGEDVEAIIPFRAEGKCQKCHNVPLNHVLGIAHINLPMTRIRSSIAENAQQTALITFGFGFVTLFLGVVVYRSLIRQPIKTLLTATEALGRGNLNHTISIKPSGDEIGKLIASFEQMRVALKNAQSALRTSTVGQIASSLIRDFRSPIRVITGAVDKIQTGTAAGPELAALCGSAKGAAMDMNRMAADLLDFTTGEMKANKRSANIGSLLQFIASNVRPDLERDSVTLTIRNEHPGSGDVDYERFAGAVKNIILYSVNYIPPGGEIVLHATQRQQGFHLKIADNGSSVPEKFKDRIFEPFTKVVQEKGLGLNMALAKRVIEIQGGTIDVESWEGKGTTFSIEMP